MTGFYMACANLLEESPSMIGFYIACASLVAATAILKWLELTSKFD